MGDNGAGVVTPDEGIVSKPGSTVEGRVRVGDEADKASNAGSIANIGVELDEVVFIELYKGDIVALYCAMGIEDGVVGMCWKEVLGVAFAAACMTVWMTVVAVLLSTTVGEPIAGVLVLLRSWLPVATGVNASWQQRRDTSHQHRRSLN